MTEGLHGLHGWQYLFMVLGGITIVYSFVFWVRPPALAVYFVVLRGPPLCTGLVMWLRLLALALLRVLAVSDER